MPTLDVTDLKSYGELLRSYSTSDLEDIYFHINVLKEPLRYRLVRMELEARRLAPAASARIALPYLPGWLSAKPALHDRPIAMAAAASFLLLTSTFAITAAALFPFWLLAVPLKFTGIQSAIVYLLCAPVPPLVGAVYGIRMGGRGVYALCVVAGIGFALLAFSFTAAPGVIAHSLIPTRGPGANLFGGF